jgi:hypothetical protein
VGCSGAIDNRSGANDEFRNTPPSATNQLVENANGSIAPVGEFDGRDPAPHQRTGDFRHHINVCVIENGDNPVSGDGVEYLGFAVTGQWSYFLVLAAYC